MICSSFILRFVNCNEPIIFVMIGKDLVYCFRGLRIGLAFIDVYTFLNQLYSGLHIELMILSICLVPARTNRFKVNYFKYSTRIQSMQGKIVAGSTKL